MAENYITCQEANGSINISEDVISTMVRAAVLDVEGVAGLSNTAGAEIAERAFKALRKLVDSGRVSPERIRSSWRRINDLYDRFAVGR